MRAKLIPAVLSLLVLATPVLVFAQRTTGDLVGVIKDDSGAVLPGVTRHPQGREDRRLAHRRHERPGSLSLRRSPPRVLQRELRDVGLRDGQPHRREDRPGGHHRRERQPEGVADGRGDHRHRRGGRSWTPPPTPSSTTYDKDWVRNAPIPRFTFFDFLNSAPGVSQTAQGELAVDLARLLDQRQLLPCSTARTSPPRTPGAAWPWPNTDAVEEIEVLSLGAPAEYGGLMGAVFNVVTRQGSNTFHGDANFYFQNQGLTSRNTTDAQDDGLPYHRDKYNDATFQLSGPAIKDKLWFFGSYQYQRDYESQPGTDPTFPSRFEADRIFFKANYQISPKHKLMFAYHDDFYRIPFTATALTSPSSIAVEHGHNPSPNLTYTAVVSDKTYFEARALRVLRQGSRRPPRSERAPGQARGTTTWTAARSRVGSTRGTTATAGRAAPPPRCPTSPTTSWARATTSSSACSTTKADTTTSMA